MFDTPAAVVGDDAGPGDLLLLDYELGNVVVASSGEGGDGIVISNDGAAGSIVAANFVGVNRTGNATNLGNSDSGIRIDSSNNQLGPGNRIAHNGSLDSGIHVSSGTGNRIVANSIHDNIGLGIALDGGTNNDLAVTLTSVTTSNISSTVAGTPGESYLLEVFTNDSCTGAEGKTFVGSVTVFNGASDRAITLPPGAHVTATATHTTAPFDTSEFSNCVTVAGGSGGTLSGSLSTTSGNVNLTTIGTQDWAIWGHAGGGTSTSLVPDVRKAGGTAISNLTDIQPTPAPLRGIGQFAAENPFTFDWTGGFPVTAATNALGGLQHDGQPTPPGTVNDGFSFTVPASTTSRTLRVFVSAHWGTGRLTATLSDGSAPAYVNSAVVGTRVPEGGNAPGVYTITYSAASAVGTLNVEWIETVADDPSTGTDNVALYAVALQGPGGGGASADPPVLFAAVPNASADPNPTGVAGLVEKDGLPAGTAFQVSFFSADDCDDETSTLGSPRTVVTNANGIAAFALDGLPPTGVGRAVFARASLGGGPPSDLSNCVIADRNNTSWPTALPLDDDANDSDNGFLRSKGQARWFKVPILANSRVERHALRTSLLTTTSSSSVTSRPAYNRHHQGRRTHAGPESRAQRPRAGRRRDAGRRLQHVAVQPVLVGRDELGPDAQQHGLQPDRVVAVGVVAVGVERVARCRPTEWSPTEWSPTEWSPTEWSPSEWSPSEWSASQWSPTEWSSSNPADPRDVLVRADREPARRLRRRPAPATRASP